jgi:D-alanyl-D-alanine carboxypeptidase
MKTSGVLRRTAPASGAGNRRAGGPARGRHRALVLLAAIPALLVNAALAAGPAGASISPAQGTLQRDVDAVHAAGVVGVLAEVVDHGHSTTARAGVARLGRNEPVPFDGRFRTGSVTKTFMATLVLQLVGQGKLTLDDTVEKWLPGVIRGNGNDGRNISVRELLNHTSGLFDYTSDASFGQTLLTPDAFLANRFRHYTPRDLINIALSHAPVFAPGTGYAYASTNYIVAGEIIKAVTGKTWDVELRQRILEPLHLGDTVAPGDNPLILGPHLDGYHIYTSDPAQRAYTDTTVDDMTWAGAAGALVTTTADVNRFYSALLSGRILRPAQLAEMKSASAAAPPSVGLGIGHQTLDCGTEMWGHTGQVMGYSTYVFSTGDGSRSVVLAMATSTFTEAQFFNDVANASFQVIEHVFCPGSTGAAASRRSLSPALPGVRSAASPTRL